MFFEAKLVSDDQYVTLHSNFLDAEKYILYSRIKINNLNHDFPMLPLPKTCSFKIFSQQPRATHQTYALN